MNGYHHQSSRPLYVINAALSTLNTVLWLWNAGAPSVATFWGLVAAVSIWAYVKDF